MIIINNLQKISITPCYYYYHFKCTSELNTFYSIIVFIYFLRYPRPIILNNTIPATATNTPLVTNTSISNASTTNPSYISLTEEQLLSMNNFEICNHIYTLLINYKIQVINPSEIIRLVSFCENVNELLNDDLTLLNTASCLGLAEIVQILIDKGADVNRGDDNNYTPLYNAVEKGHQTVVNILLQANAEIDCIEIDGRTPLCAAAFHRHPSITDMLMKAGADINYQCGGHTPLHDAAWAGDIESLKLLIGAGVNLFHTNTSGRTALHNAAYAHQNRTMAVPILIRAGLDPNQADDSGQTPVNLASRYGRTEALKQLIEAGGIVTGNDLLSAAEFGYYEAVRVLVNAKVDITYANSKCETALHLAASGLRDAFPNNYNHAEVIKILGDAGANVHLHNNKGMAPLHVAISSDTPKPDIVKRLIEICADINQPTLLNFSGDQPGSRLIKDKRPLHLSVEYGHTSLTMLLLQNNANANMTDKHGMTPLHLAVIKRNPEAVQLLIDSGANTDPVDIISKETPLYKAANNVRNSTTDQLKRTHTDIIKILLKAGADLDKVNEAIRDENLNTPFKIINNLYTKDEIVELLELKPTPDVSIIFRDKFDRFLLFNMTRQLIRKRIRNSPNIASLPLPEAIKNRIRANHDIEPSLVVEDHSIQEIEPTADSEKQKKPAKNPTPESLPRTQDEKEWTTVHQNRRMENKDFIESRRTEERRRGFGSTEPSKIKRDPNKFNKTFKK